jgi:ABC-type transport system involved in multi-copper enzyme maturation permease subunit
MTFLPIVERELRVSARRGSTYWSRAGVAAAALILFGAIIGLASLQRSGLAGQLGPILFGIFSWLSFIAVCAAGVFLTSDSLSEEKREGTLGLLFLTDLRGYDVVFGKLLATSLLAAYGLLAAFPVIGLGFLLGGVTGLEFGRLVLVLCNTLFFSLALGICVSTVSRDAQRAMTGAVLLSLVVLAVFPAVDWAVADWDNANFVPRLSLFSPTHGFGQVRDLRPSGFGLNLGLVHAMSWLLLAVASFLAARTWQEKSSNNERGAASRGHRLRFGSPAKRAALRRRLLADNPVRWLALRELWLGRFMGIFWLAVAGVAWVLYMGIGSQQTAWSVGYGLYYLVGFVFKLWLVSQACRFFADSMRSGTLELLLASPLGSKEIVSGQAWALRRRFLLPALLLLCAQAALSAGQIQLIAQSMAGAGGPATASAGSGINEFVLQQIVSAAGSLVSFITGLFALGWFGMWMGLTSKKASLAVIKTIVFVQVVPGVALTFLSGLLMFGMAFAQWPGWMPGVILTVVTVGVHGTFIMVARRHLFTRFRETVARAGAVSTAAKPPALPPLVQPNNPPVLTS